MMVRFVALLGAVGLLVCQSAGLDAADVEEQDEFNKPYAPDSSYADLNALLGNNVPSLHSASKRQQSDREREVEAAQTQFYPYGRRTDPRKASGGFTFGKRGQYFIPIPYEKREMDEVNPYSVAKRDDELTGLEEYQASKRSGPYSFNSGLTFGKREPEKRNIFGSYDFGKRAYGNNFSFGKRGMGVSSFSFGKRSGLEGEQMMPEDKRAFGDFSFGKRNNGLSSFTFGKREGER
ncbi:uncharacterized protein [Asterias amurensis]|uniref:uncharacterized protein n=1 Tax=Asterias amurensis TaxID=7602 RepID=UPI003AB39E58